MLDSDTGSHEALLVCSDLASYEAAIRAWTPGSGRIPILGQGAVLGLPERIGPRSTSEPVPDPRRRVLALDEPSCRASAGLLARATGRVLEVLADAAWESHLSALLDGELVSLTLVVPAWGERGEPQPDWLGRVLGFMRANHARARALTWGTLIAADPATLSRLVAKALLQPEILAHYAAERALLFTTGTAAGNWIRLPIYDPQPAEPQLAEHSPFAVVDDRHITSKSSATIVDRRWSMMFFKGHGRAYCAIQGHLCGARPLALAPESAAETCVLGMDCASPHDDAYQPGFPGFPRIDPRRYDTPIMVLDCCGTGNWSFPSWAQGIPSLAFHALAGAPSGIITGDQVTMTRSGNYLDVLWALGSSPTLGEAVARLNETRPDATARFAYFVLGDPELPTGPARWPRWVVDAPVEAEAEGLRATIPIHDAPFVSIDLGPSDLDRAQTSFVRCEDTSVQLGTPRRFQSSRAATLWLSVADEQARREPVEVIVESRPSLAVSASLLHAVTRLDALLGPWSPALQPQAIGLRKAAERLSQIAGKLRALEQRAILGRVGDFEVALELAERGWQTANQAALERAIELFGAGGLWPYRMWAVAGFIGESCPEPCPYCGLAPTLLRRYAQLPATTREQWECMRCALIQDRPQAEGPTLSLRAPEQIAIGEVLAAEFELDNRDGAWARTGAGLIQVDTTAHGVVARPQTPMAIALPPGQSFVGRFELALPERPAIAHLYCVRVLILLDGDWFLASRPIRVG